MAEPGIRPTPQETRGADQSLSGGDTHHDSGTYGVSIFPQHQAKLKESAVNPDVARERGYVTADNKAQLGRYGFSPVQRRVPALIIPVHGVDGGVVGYQVRPDSPRTINGKPAKYETRAAQEMVVDVPPRVQPHLSDPTRPMIITEGPIKADSAVSHGLDCIALLGVWAWKGGKGKVALPDWDSVALNGREVYVCFDSDVMPKPQVATAMKRLGEFLARRGAEVAYIYLPEADPGSKVGLDDWLAAGNPAASIFDLCDSEIRKPTAPTDRLVCFAPASPMPNARLAVDGLYRTDAGLELRYWRGGFYWWEGTYWPEMALDELKSVLYALFETAVYMSDEGAKPFDPNRYKLADLIDAAKAVTIIPKKVDPPAYIDEDSNVDPAELLPVRNGLLHLPTRKLYEHSPHFFNEFSLPYDYELAAPTPARWLAFLADLWGDDQESIDLLREWFGYCVAGDTSQHKIKMLLGPIRAGKGTIGRVLKSLVGSRNFTGPTLASFATNFGLQDLVGKPVAIISDARMPRHEGSVIIERLLSVSGEDTLTVDRKYRDHWTGKLPTRFTILTNELPGLFDSSGAIASRFLVLRLTRSFYNREDPTLFSKLLPELPGILNWSLKGLERLQSRGHFVQPGSSLAVIDEMRDLASPVGAFLRDRCQVAAGYTVAVDDFWKAWKDWCDDHGRKPGTRAVLGRDLRAQVPEIEVTQPRVDDRRVRHYEGLRLRPPGHDDDLSGQNNDVARVPSRAIPEPGTGNGTGKEAQDPRSDGLARDGTGNLPLNRQLEDVIDRAGPLCDICAKPNPDSTQDGFPVHTSCLVPAVRPDEPSLETIAGI